MEKQFGICPDIQTYAIFIYHYLRCGKMDKAAEIIEEIEVKGLELSKLLFNSHFHDHEEEDLLKTFLSKMGKLENIEHAPNESLLLSAFEDMKKYSEKSEEFHQDYYTAEEYEDIKKIRSTELVTTSSSGTSILKKALDGFSRLDSMEKYNRQMWIESRSYAAAVEQSELENQNIPEDQKRADQNMPKEILKKWHDDLTTAIKASLEKIEEDRENPDPLLPFLKLLTPEQLSKITIAEFMHSTQSSIRNNPQQENLNQLFTFGQVHATNLVRDIGLSLQREYNLQQLSSPSRRKELNIKKNVHQLHANGKLLNLTLRKVLQKAQNEMKTGKQWNPFWGNKNIIQIGAFLAKLFTEVATITVTKTEDNASDGANSTKSTKEIPAVKHTLVFCDGKNYGTFVFDPAVFQILAAKSVNIAPWCLPMVVPPLPWITWTSGGYLQCKMPFYLIFRPC